MSERASYVWAQPMPAREARRAAITAQEAASERAVVRQALTIAEVPLPRREAVAVRAAGWVRAVRAQREQQSTLDAFMHQYDLSSEEGVLLMCLAEALLRIPDDDTAEKLIADKLAGADWEAHLGRSDSLFVNASTWGLMLTGRIVQLAPETTGNFRAALNRLVNRSTEPVIRVAVRQAMRLMGAQFVMGRDIGEALRRARAGSVERHSFDMLGEAALSAADAQRYFEAYAKAIIAIGASARKIRQPEARPGISVKLSALHPRYEFAQRRRVLAELAPRLLALARLAREQGIGLTVDAEEADRLELSLDIFAAVYPDAALDGWEGFGLAVQAFQKRALSVIDWLAELARGEGRRIAVRLVKGAYWDTEIKRAQEQGLAHYPVFTRKVNTDVAFLACARHLLDARHRFYPMLATHNAQTIAALIDLAGDDLGGFELQRLHGMGEALHAQVRADIKLPCRVYAPVGSHADLLPYLVRRLLENGANTSFVNRIFDERLPPEQLVADPRVVCVEQGAASHPRLPLPVDLYGAQRRNSRGLNFADEAAMRELAQQLQEVQAPALARSRSALPLPDGARQAIENPSDRRRTPGHWERFDPAGLPAVLDAARAAQPRWNAVAAHERAQILQQAADRLEAARPLFMQLLVCEAGKTLPDALAEVREATDLLRYYAAQAVQLLGAAQPLPGPTGEYNELQLHGRGVFACISPWNFPLAIFCGQIAAALLCGNSVIAKPAEQTPLIAMQAVDLLHGAGVPADVLQLLLGEGELGAALCAAPQIAGVAFTGSFEVAQRIHRSLAAREGPIATLIAETGGLNAMIADSSALPEQLVRDVIRSAFHSAGQRCSALRVLYLQDDIATHTLEILAGAMQELVIGDPALLSTDLGPLIDAEAKARIDAHLAGMRAIGRLIATAPLADDVAARGHFVAPTAIEIQAITEIGEEPFGPVLHVIRYPAAQLDAVIDAINASGYGLTLGVHTRIESTWRQVQARARVGNCYVNRSMTGAVVGSQPFGGAGLSGTGPKAGGPHYLLRFVTERALCVNTTAVGGNAGLLAQRD